jgi:hypothetical protein
VDGFFDPARCCAKVSNVSRQQERQNRLNDIFELVVSTIQILHGPSFSCNALREEGFESEGGRLKNENCARKAVSNFRLTFFLLVAIEQDVGQSTHQFDCRPDDYYWL